MGFEDLYLLQKGYVLDDDPRSNRLLPLKCAGYIKKRISMDISTGYGYNIVNGVRHFFRSNSLDFPLKHTDIPEVQHSGSRVILRDEIRRWVDLCVGNRHELRSRVLGLVSKDLGFCESDIGRLDVDHVLGARVVETDGGVFRVFEPFVTKKTGCVAYPHWGPEAEAAALEYIGDRVSGPLFISQKGGRMSAKTIGAMFNRFKRRDDTPKLSHHSLRKFHRTALEAVMPESYVKKLQGKSTDPYIHPEQTGELTEAYIRHYDAIRVYRETQEVEHLKKELAEQREEHTDLELRLRDAEQYIQQQRIEQAIRRELDKQQNK